MSRPDPTNPRSHSPQDVRQGRIVLESRRQRLLLGGGLAAFVILVLAGVVIFA